MLGCALLVAGCGGGEPEPPPLSAALAESLAGRSDSVASLLGEQDNCGAKSEARRLQADAIAAINTRRVPAVYQEELLADVTALAETIACPGPASAKGNEVAARSLSDWLRAAAG